MADVETWLSEVAGALDVTLEDVLPEGLQSGLLDLTGDIAHNVVRLAVPLSSYLIGVAVGRGATPEEAIAAVAALLPKGDT
jgi:ribosomal protein S12 methylthiotransferase accessory factor YcaO